MKREKKIKLPALTRREYEHLLAACHFFEAEWDSHGAYGALRKDVRTAQGPYMLRGEWVDFEKRIEAVGNQEA